MNSNKPVAWMDEETGCFVYSQYEYEDLDEHGKDGLIPLYTHPVKELNNGGEPVKNATYWKRQYNLMASQNDNLKSGLYHANEQIKYLESHPVKEQDESFDRTASHMAGEYVSYKAILTDEEIIACFDESEPVAWVYPEGLEALKAGKPWTAYGTRQEPNNTALYLSPQPDIPPYAWVTFTPYGDEDDVWYENPEGQLLEGWTYKPLYDTTPPKKAELTDEEIEEVFQETIRQPNFIMLGDTQRFARAILRKAQENE